MTDQREGTANSVSRRRVVQGAAWAVPVIAMAAIAPRAAASGPRPCTPVSFVISPDHVTAPADQTIVLSTVDSLGNVYTISISSATSSDTVIGQGNPSAIPPAIPPIPYVSYNMNTAGNGWNGGAAPDGSKDFVFTGFAPTAGAGAVVLNQRARVAPEPTGNVPQGSAADKQKLTFVFTKNGAIFNPVNFSLDIFDITSADSGSTVVIPGTTTLEAWRATYWDAVGFSAVPASIAYTGTATYGRGAGIGSLGDPYRRSQKNQQTVLGVSVSDRFTFGSFPSGSTMEYSNFSDRRGWHFISISGIAFEVDDCVPAP